MTNRNVGEYTSMALDSSDKPHISYYDDTHNDLKYAHKTSSEWSTEIVDQSHSVGQYSSIALDSNDKPHISYYDVSHNDLKYAFLMSEERHDPVLSNGFVNPGSGTTSTDFYYYVSYYDEDGDSPSIKRVVVDGVVAHNMGLWSGTPSNGVYYYGPKNLSLSSHNYYFYFEDGNCGTDRLPATGSYSGPTVSGDGWDPWAYDDNPKDGIIQKMEAIHAVQDYFHRDISKMQAIEVVMLYFSSKD